MSARLFAHLAAAVDRRHEKLPPFPRKFSVVEPQPGVRLCLLHVDEDAGIVQYVHEDALAGEILRYAQRQGKSLAKIDMDAARRAARYWIHSVVPLPDEPAAVLQKSEPGLTFHRLPFDAVEGEPHRCPRFEEFLSRCTNGESIAVFIGSLFDPHSDRQQYVWLHGDGQNGKGALVRFMARILGRGYASEVVPTQGDRFWTSNLVGKRLVVFPDCNSPQFPQSGLFKSLTGGDLVKVERKGKDAYTAELHAKFMFLSNEELIISSQMSDQRRAIYCHVAAIQGEPDPNYEAELWDEAPHILGECIALYRARCGAGRRIPVAVGAEAQSELHDERYVEIFEKYFVQCGDTHRILREREHVPPHVLMGRLRAEGLTSPREQSKALDFFKRRYGVEKTQVKLPDNQVVKRYVGLRQKLYSVGNSGGWEY